MRCARHGRIRRHRCQQARGGTSAFASDRAGAPSQLLPSSSWRTGPGPLCWEGRHFLLQVSAVKKLSGRGGGAVAVGLASDPHKGDSVPGRGHAGPAREWQAPWGAFAAPFLLGQQHEAALGVCSAVPGSALRVTLGTSLLTGNLGREATRKDQPRPAPCHCVKWGRGAVSEGRAPWDGHRGTGTVDGHRG